MRTVRLWLYIDRFERDTAGRERRVQTRHDVEIQAPDTPGEATLNSIVLCLAPDGGKPGREVAEVNMAGLSPWHEGVPIALLGGAAWMSREAL